MHVEIIVVPMILTFFGRFQKIHKQEQLLGRLQTLVHGKGSTSQHVSEVLNYFLQRLASQQTPTRQLAVKVGLCFILIA